VCEREREKMKETKKSEKIKTKLKQISK